MYQTSAYVLTCLFRVSYYKGKPDHAAAIYHIFLNHMYQPSAYVLTCLQDSWPDIAMKGFEPATFGLVF